MEMAIIIAMNTLNPLMGPLTILLGYLIATSSKWTNFYLGVGFMVLVTANTFWQIEVVGVSAKDNLVVVCIYLFNVTVTALVIRNIKAKPKRV